MKVLSINKRAFFDYHISETYEAGIVLSGPEVKSVKAGNIDLKGAYITVANNEVYLINASIAPYKFARQENYQPRHTRKLLLHKKEIDYLLGKSKERGITILPLKVYLKGGLVKLTIGIARSKKKYDKREIIKKREAEREIERHLKRRLSSQTWGK